MKRILVLALALIVTVGSLAVPSYAAEIEVDDQWINVLDYATLDSDNYILASTSQTVKYVLPFVYSASSIDMVVLCEVKPTSVAFYDTYLNIVSLGNNLYRIYGSRSNVGYTNTVQLVFKFSKSTGLNFLALKVASVPIEQSTIPAVFYLSSPYHTLTLEYTGTSGVTGGVDVTQAVIENNMFISTLTIDGSDWLKYDFVDIVLFMSGDSINSLSCYVDGSSSDGDYVLNPTYSVVENTEENSRIAYVVTASVDLRTLDRSQWGDNSLVFEITGSFSPVSGGLASLSHTFAVNSVVGSLALNNIDPEVFWLRRLYNGISSWFTNLEETIISSNTALGELVSGFHSGMNSWFESLSTMLQDQHEAEIEIQNNQNEIISNGFANLKTWLESGFSAVNTNLSSLISRVNVFNTNVGEWINTVVSRINQFNTNVGTWFSDLKSHLTGLFNSLFEILNSSGDNDGFNSDVADQGDKLDDMQDVMDSVTQPAIDSIDTDLSGIVSAADTANIAEVYTVVIGDGPMVSIMTMVVVMAMMSFVLFGKR